MIATTDAEQIEMLATGRAGYAYIGPTQLCVSSCASC